MKILLILTSINFVVATTISPISIDENDPSTISSTFGDDDTTSSNSQSYSLSTNNVESDDSDCEISDVNYELSNDNFLTISWKLPSSQNWLCNSTFLQVNLTRKTCVNVECENPENEVEIMIPSANKSYRFPEKLIACEDYEVLVIKSDITELVIYESKIEANIEYDQVIIKSISQYNSTSIPVDFVWQYDNHPACPRSFDVRVYGANYIYEQNGITDLNITVTTLQPCETYIFKVYPTNAEHLAVNQTYTLNFMIPSSVRNLTTRYIEDDTFSSIEVTWDEPEEYSKCVIGYFIEIKNEFGNPHRDRNSTNPYVQISNVYACTNYKIKVTAKSENIDSAAVEIEIRMPPKTYKKPSMRVIDITSKSVSLNATVDSESEWNFCEIEEYLFKCDNFENSSEVNVGFLENLKPFTEYNCTVKVKIQESDEFSNESEVATFITREGKPSLPEFDSKPQSGTTSCSISWKPPNEPNGRIISFLIYVKFQKFLYFIPDECALPYPFNGFSPISASKLKIKENQFEFVEFNVSESSLNYVMERLLPYSQYTFQIKAYNNEESSDFSSIVTCETKQELSEKVRSLSVARKEQTNNEEYNQTVVISWKHPCITNSEIDKFLIHSHLVGGESFYDEVQYEQKIDFDFASDNFKPDSLYDVSIVAVNSKSENGTEEKLRYLSKAGIPNFITDEILKKIQAVPTTNTIKFQIPRRVFNSNVGLITKLAFLVIQADCGLEIPEEERDFISKERSIGFWLNSTTYECMPQYRAIEVLPTTGKDQTLNNSGYFDVTIGSDSCSSNVICNGPLRPGKYFEITFRLYTSQGFSDIYMKKVRLESEVPFMLILILVLSVISAVFFIGLYISYRRTEEFRKKIAENIDNKDISTNDFRRFYDTVCLNNHAKLKDEFTSIQTFSESLEKTCIASRASERLNRYMNISPFDENRVVLDADEFENDYINASFIRGYNDTLRGYIATQGPLARTSHDFWRMIVQYRVEQIVMLTGLIEGDKNKCHEYFPKHKGTVTFSNMKITCIDEANGDHYIRRTLEVENNDVKRVVKHFYFKSWPDHGVPSTTGPLINFCKMLRKDRKIPDGTIVVHCSAGVGRTGTFIATDIIMQKLKQEQKINIYDLVKKLREQRVKMVQSIEQYIFLYKLSMELVDAEIHRKKWKVINFINQLTEKKENNNDKSVSIKMNPISDTLVTEEKTRETVTRD